MLLPFVPALPILPTAVDVFGAPLELRGRVVGRAPVVHRPTRGTRGTPRVLRHAVQRRDGTVRPARTTADKARILRRLAQRPVRAFRRLAATLTAEHPIDFAALRTIADKKERRAAYRLASAPLAAAWSEHLRDGGALRALTLLAQAAAPRDPDAADAVSELYARLGEVAYPAAFVRRVARRHATRRERRAEERLAARDKERLARTPTTVDHIDVTAAAARVMAEHGAALAALAAPVTTGAAFARRELARSILSAAIDAEEVTAAS